MLLFFTPNRWFARAGLSLYCLHLWLFIICLPPFHAGTWFQTEPSMMAIFALAALSALWLAVGISQRFLALQRPVHPLLWVMLAWVAWQVIALCFADNHYRAWFGIPQTGEGAAWNMALCLSFFLAMPLWQRPDYRKILLSVALVSLGVMAWLHFFPARFCDPKLINDIINNPNAPSNWPDYMGFIVGWLWILYATTPHLRTAFRHCWMVIFISIILLVAENHSAHFLMFPAIIGSSVILWLQAARRLPRFLLPGKTWRILAMVGCVLPFFWAMSANKDSLFPDKNCASLQQRAGFNQASLVALEREPCRLAAGKGWGSFGDDFFKNALFDHTHMFQNGEYNVNWVGLSLNVFHTHNQPLAVLLALGLPGLFLFFAIPMAAIWPVRRELFWWCVPVLLAVNTLGYVWFVIPLVLAFQALGLAALCAARRPSTGAAAPISRWFIVPALLAALALAYSSSVQYDAMAYGSRFEHILDEDPSQPGAVDWLAQDIARGGDRLIESTLFHAEHIAGKISKDEATDKDRDWFRNFLTVAHRAAMDAHTNPRLVMLETKLVMGLFRILKPSPLDALRPEVKANIPDMIVRFSEIAPDREDFTVPFFLGLDDFAHGDKEVQIALLERVLAVAPNHRSALWLLGSIYEGEGATKEKGIELKKRAAKLGVGRVFPVTDAELAAYL